MITKGCGIIGLIAAAMVFTWTLDDASAADFVEITKAVKLSPKPPVSVTTSSSVKAKLDFNQKFSSISNVCFRFLFVDDLLDPGDELTMTLSKEFGIGFVNPGNESQSDRVLCTGSDIYNPGVVNLFLDGKQDFDIIMNHGSVTVGALSATITGYSQ